MKGVVVNNRSAVVFGCVDQALKSKKITIFLSSCSDGRRCEVVNYCRHWCQKFKYVRTFDCFLKVC